MNARSPAGSRADHKHTAVQLSPTNSPISSKKSTPVHENAKACKLFTMEGNGPVAKYTPGGEAIQLNLPRDLAAS